DFYRKIRWLIDLAVKTSQESLDLNDHFANVTSVFESNRRLEQLFCELSPEVHDLLNRLRKVDVKFLIENEEMRRKILLQLPYNFCARDYFLSKCLCDKKAVPMYCLMMFTRKSIEVYANNYTLPCATSVSTTPFFMVSAIILLIKILMD
ncbi:hypothetical protein PFISCL1PPCAC_12062, partial [Pristionchus fissidentatus]